MFWTKKCVESEPRKKLLTIRVNYSHPLTEQPLKDVNPGRCSENVGKILEENLQSCLFIICKLEPVNMTKYKLFHT